MLPIQAHRICSPVRIDGCDDLYYDTGRRQMSRLDRMLTIITNCEYSYEKFKKNRKDAYIIRREEQKSGEDPI